MRVIDANCVVGNDYRDCISPDTLLNNMDINGIDKCVIFPQDRWAAVNNSEGNDFLADTVKKYPKRLFCFVAVNPWYGIKAAIELESRLKDGFNGVYFKSTVQGFAINDEIVYPLIELCERYDVPVYFHTGTPAHALPFQVMYLARRFPRVNFIIGHLGAYDYIGDAFASAEMTRNIYLETSWTLTCHMRIVSDKFPNRVVFGSGVPRSSQQIELKKIRAAVENEQKLNQILSTNILSILGGSK